MGGVINRRLTLNAADAQRLGAIRTSGGNIITAEERRRLERQCNNRLNWSDGGHWIGSGPEPNCFQRSTMTGGATIVYQFPTDQAAFKWNTEWQKLIMRTGHFATAVVTVIVATTTSGLAGIAVGTLAAILKDEVQAMIPYPQVSRGWRYVVTINHTFRWSPHPWGRNEFYQEMSGTTFDTAGRSHYRAVARTEFPMDVMPENLAIQLASMTGSTTTVQYQ